MDDGDIERVAPWFECDGDGYPTEESIERLGKMDMTRDQARAFLLADLPEIAKGVSCLRVWNTEVERYGKPAIQIDYATGGWSGAEDLIGAMLDNFWLTTFYTKWERGGLWTFEVSPHRIVGVPPGE